MDKLEDYVDSQLSETHGLVSTRNAKNAGLERPRGLKRPKSAVTYTTPTYPSVGRPSPRKSLFSIAIRPELRLGEITATQIATSAP